MMADAVFDKKDQLDRIAALVMPQEVLYAVYDMKGGGTGFVGITDRRLLFMDESFVRKSKVLVSLPYSKLTAVGVGGYGPLVESVRGDEQAVCGGRQQGMGV